MLFVMPMAVSLKLLFQSKDKIIIWLST